MKSMDLKLIQKGMSINSSNKIKYFRFEKLVRDRIVELMNRNGQLPNEVRVLGDDEFLKELIRKLIEEALEIQKAENIDDVREEVSDVQEILDYIKKTIGFTKEDLNRYQKIKHNKNGGFDKREYIGNVGVEVGTKWYKYYKKNPEKYPEIAD